MPALQLSGLASGFDWKTLVDQLMDLERVPINRLQAEKLVNERKDNALETLGTKLSALKTAVTDLKAEGLFDGRKATSGTTNSTWSVSAGAATALGNYSIAVTQLATESKRTGSSDIGSGLAATDDVSGVTLANLNTAVAPTAGTFTVNGQQVTVALTDSLQSVFDAISTATSGAVTASYSAATDKVTFSSAGEITLGAANDTSNLLNVLKLANNGTGTIASSAALGTVKTASALSSAGLRTAITAVDGNGDGSFTVNGVSISYNVNNDSLSAVLKRITDSTAGVTASYDTINDRVILTNKTTGDTNVAVSEAAGGFLDAVGLTGASTLTRGKNALFSVNGGGTLTSQSNTFDSAVHGVAGLSVTAKTETTETISVTADTASMRTKLDTFISKFNDVQDYIDEQTKITSSNGKVTAATLASNREIQDWGRSLRSNAFASISGLSTVADHLSDFGIDFDGSTSKLSIKDSAKLDTLLKDKSAEVTDYFRTATTGFVAKFETFMTSAIGSDGATGNLGTQRTTLKNSNTSIDSQIADIERRIVQQRELLTTSFIAMETAQSQIQQQGQALTNAFFSGSKK